MDLLQALNWRYAVKQFSDQSLDSERLDVLLEAARLSPSAYGLQPYRLFVVTDKALRTKLPQYSYDQNKVSDSSHLVVFTARRDINSEFIREHVQQLASARQLDVNAQAERQRFYQEMLVDSLTVDERALWSKEQTYLALGNFLTSAALLEIDACPMTGIQTEHYDRLLGLDSQGLTTVAVCALGQRSSEDTYSSKAKVRLPIDQLVEWVEG
ncbi:NAD(P)H-dependent oxidoreductase [Pseudomaricurvus sp.]|uniref:NAD(P)H-dependent oxidoreductase n=1 Tax=Pseudomaricurvus sp. TaxID=2004510 RepID=UPI003F6D8428